MSVEDWPKVAIIVLNWNGWRDTIECLESLRKLSYPNYFIVVVDNGSSDDSVERIKAWARGENSSSVSQELCAKERPSHSINLVEYTWAVARTGGLGKQEEKFEELPRHDKVVLITVDKNLGFAGGNNVGTRYALRSGAEWVLLLNNDTVVDPWLLDQMILGAKLERKVGVVGPKILFYDNPSVIQSVGGTLNLWTGRGYLRGHGEADHGQYDQPHDVDWVSGAAIFIRAEALQKVGLLDESYFLCYEETDLCYRIKKAGYSIRVIPTARVWHKGSRSLHKPNAEYYLTRNRALFMRKHGTKLQRLIFGVFYLLGSLKRGIIFALRGEKDCCKAVFSGLRDGLLYLAKPKV